MVSSILAVCAIAAASGEIDEKGLYGRWKFDGSSGIVEEIEFRANHSFRGDIIDKGVVTWKFAGSWRMEGDQLIYLYTESSDQRVPRGMADEDKVITIDKDGFSIRNRGNQVHRYTRVK